MRPTIKLFIIEIFCLKLPHFILFKSYTAVDIKLSLSCMSRLERYVVFSSKTNEGVLQFMKYYLKIE